MSSKMKRFEQELREEHERLTNSYNESQEKLSIRQEKHAEKKAALQQFRAEYGVVIDALDKAEKNGSVEIQKES